MTILSNGHQWKFSEFLDNNDYSFIKKNILNSLSEKEINGAIAKTLELLFLATGAKIRS